VAGQLCAYLDTRLRWPAVTPTVSVIQGAACCGPRAKRVSHSARCNAKALRNSSRAPQQRPRGFDHGVGHPLLFRCDTKAPDYRKNKGFKDLGHYSEWPKVADAVIKAGPGTRGRVSNPT